MRILPIFHAITASVLGALVPLTALAVKDVPSPVTTAPGVQKTEDLEKIVRGVGNIFAAIVFAVGVIMILRAAWFYLTSGGDEEKVKSAHNSLIYGIVGLAVALFAFVAVRLVENFLGGAGPPTIQ